jgi:DNA-binding CsgD family transcriptional regulator
VSPSQTQRPELLERASELDAVSATLDSAGAGSGGLVVVEGPAGIGKSSILIEGRAHAAERGSAVLAARGTEIERAFSYGVVRQLFEPALRQVSDEQRRELFAGAAAQASRLFEPVETEAAAAGEDTAFALMHGLYWLALNVAEQKPLAIVVDDLQWADAASTRWLAYLGRRLEATSIAVLAGVRPVEDEDPALVELLADPITVLVRPSALSASAVGEIARTQLDDVEPAFAEAIHRTTGGNPLLVQELLRTLAEEAVPATASSIAVVERTAPGAVSRSVALRLSRLPEPAQALARAIAILGDDTDGRNAIALAGIQRRELAPSAAALARVNLLDPNPPLRFVHPVVRNAAYEGIDAHTRGEEHARAARLLAEAGEPNERIAAQLLLAPPQSVEDGVAPLREAARQAAREGSPESAAAYLRRALAEPVPPGERAALLIELADADFALGAEDVVAHLRDAIDLLEDGESRVAAEWQLGRALYWVGDEEAGIEMLERALAERPGAVDDLQRRVQADLFANATRVAERFQEARQRLAEIEVDPDDGPGSRMLLGLQAYHEGARGGDRERAIAYGRAALVAMPPDERAWNYTGGIYALLHSDEIDEALQLLEAPLAATRRSGAVFNFSGLSMTRAMLEYAGGELLEAEADARAALDALPHRNAWFVPHAHAWLAQILVERNALDEAEATLSGVAEGTEAVADPFARTPVLRARGMLRLARANHRGALSDAMELGRALSAFGHDNPAASNPSWRSLAALAQHGLGDEPAARELVEEDLGLARAWGAPRTLGRALRISGLLAGGAYGTKQLREAVALLEASPARLEYAYALTDLGATLRRDNHRADARDVLRPALELAQRLGADLLATRAREELVAAGARPRRRSLSGVESLTPSERRTATMAAEGLSNREIAQELFVTLRTVEMHLSNVFRKLDVSSRTQLPALVLDGDSTSSQ